MDEAEQAFHDASRPTWGPAETLVLTTGASRRLGQTTRDGEGLLALQRPHVQTDRQSVRLANFSSQVSNLYEICDEVLALLTPCLVIKDLPSGARCVDEDTPREGRPCCHT